MKMVYIIYTWQLKKEYQTMQMVIRFLNRKFCTMSFHSSTLATGFGSSFFLVKAAISALSLSRSDISGLGGFPFSVSPF